MARLILKSPYLKPGGTKSPGGYLQYIATREGVEMAEDTSRHLPATAEQRKQVEKMLKKYSDSKDSYEYQDYLDNPTRGNADAFLNGVLLPSGMYICDTSTSVPEATACSRTKAFPSCCPRCSRK